MTGKRGSLKERFERYVMPEPNSGCWLWTATCTGAGYGLINITSRQPRLAHRISWILTRGEIPDGMDVLHKCDLPLCVNPDHLFLGTHADNMADKGRKKRAPHSGSHWKAKLTSDAVLRIRADTRTHIRIAADYGISSGVVSEIKNRKAWRHVP